MKKKIVICADGTWNRPENNLKKDFPSNVLKLARAIRPLGKNNTSQQVFYDWGIGSYYDPLLGGATGKGLHKNIMDCYRYLVQNYSAGDDLYLFGFSRGAYTIRCLCGLINNCGILKRSEARLIQQAFEHYKRSGKAYAPEGSESKKFRAQHSHQSREVLFVGVWDTVGAMGIPLSFLGLFDDKDEFYDAKIGKNVRIARHALAIDEHRSDFVPTLWIPQQNLDIQQVWFAGSHSDIGGAYRADNDGSLLSDIPLLWMQQEAAGAGLAIEKHLEQHAKASPMATIHESRRSFYRIKKRYYRALNHQKGTVLIHHSVKDRWDQIPQYSPPNLKEYLDRYDWPNPLI
ncbi:MAG: DUF2235 domain-containing protein [SAR324 cluster bacterium]|nr:DUF2235 domain-containing protein [SAR324 cluster bacterium]